VTSVHPLGGNVDDMSRHVGDDTPCRSNFGQMGPCRRHKIEDVVAVCVGLSRHFQIFRSAYVEIYYGMGVNTHRYYCTYNMISTLISWFHLSKQYRRSCRAAAAAMLLPPRCRRPRAVALPPPPCHCLLVGCCVVVRRPILSSHAVMRPSTLLLPAAFADELSSTASTAAAAIAAAAGLPGRHNHHRHHRSRTPRCKMAKKAR